MDFKSIYTLYWNKIFRLCLGYVNDPDRAKDLAQETFLTVWEKLPSFRQESALGTWIFRIATNTCLQQIRTERKNHFTELPDDIPQETETNDTSAGDIARLYRFIAELKEIDRIIISLELEGMNQAEISKVVGLQEGNIRVRIHRIKEKLNEKFKKNGRQ